MTKHKPVQLKIDMPSKEMLDDVALRPISEKELEFNPAVLAKIEELMKFFDTAGINYDKFDPDSIPKLDLDDKKAYPNNDSYMYIAGQRDTQKWLQTVKLVYNLEKNGNDRVKSIRHATAGWNPMETFDFLNWLKFYESGEHLKYKFAQLWYENGEPGYFLHVKKDPEPVSNPTVTGKDIDSARDSIANEMSSSEKKQIIEKQRNKIIGRLDSAEKLLRSQEGQIFGGKEFESLLEAIYSLKKKIQTVNKMSTSTRLYDDMIVRESNVLNKKGFYKAAQVIFSLAQANNPPPAGTGKKDKDISKLPAVSPPAPPGQGSGSAGGLPSVGPGMAQNPPESAPNDTTPIGISKFLENLETGGVTTTEDKQLISDTLEVEDDYLNVRDPDEELLVVEAQAAPPPDLDLPITDSPAPSPLKPTLPKAPAKMPKPMEDKDPLEVTEEDIPKNKPAPGAEGFSNKIDAVLSNVTISDVVSELEDLAKIFKTREIPRRLGLADMMLDSLGLASFFPSLSEATNKALESNNYISTRVEDILSKLRGSMETREVDLKGDEREPNPEVAGIQKTLKDQETKEKNKKQMRKDLEEKELENKTPKEIPEVEIEEDLGAPVAPPKKAVPPPPLPRRPITPPV